MSDGKKKRLSMLDNLAAAGAAPTPGSLIASSRPLRAARNAVDSHKVWELDPSQIIDTRPTDRLETGDVIDLRDSIEATGQSVPILVRRHPSEDDKYLLVYGRRRLEAVRMSEKVTHVRALIAQMDDTKAVETQISENMARRDLTYIEKSLFARELIDSGFGNQSRVAEVLTVQKSSISMALAHVDAIGADLITAIGPAEGIGRPRWATLAQAIEDGRADRDALEAIAAQTRGRAEIDMLDGREVVGGDPSVAAFEAVMASIAAAPKRRKPSKNKAVNSAKPIPGPVRASLQRTGGGLRLDLGKGDFADWIEAHATDALQLLHDRYQERRKTTDEQ